MNGIDSIGILGAGTMGRGMAQVALLAGHGVVLYDLEEPILDAAQSSIRESIQKGVEKGKIRPEQAGEAMERLGTTTELRDVRVDLVLEAVVEKLEVKRDLFEQLQDINGPGSIYATNTSSIPVTSIARGLPHESRVVGMHFFNPAHIMKLVEVISGASTDPEVAKAIYELAESWGKKPIMAQDAPGFVVNRVARHFYVEALRILEEGVADVETIDQAMESLGFRMGPFRLMDLIGVDTNFSVTSSMYESFHFDPKFRPSRIQEQKVFAGHHGRKTGKGFYDYEA